MSVLDENLRRLLRRSYVPALPAPHFRDRLESLFLAEVARARRSRGAGARVVPPRLRVALAVAAALLAVVVGWRLVSPSAAPPAREDALARGEVVLAFPDGRWRAADPEERLHGHRVAPPELVALTPAGAGFELLVADGRIHLGPQSELCVTTGAPEPSATLLRGSAWFESGARREDLVLHRPTVLHAPAPPSPASPELASARESAAPVPAAPAASAARARRVFAGHVAAAEGSESIRAFTVALLAERRSNRAFPPIVRAFQGGDGFFAWEDPPAGKQRVFVHAEGFALASLGEFDFALAPPELLVELERGVSVRGSVLDGEGNPIPDALVLAEDEAPTDGLLFHRSGKVDWLPVRATSGPDGRFELAHVAPGAHTLRVEAEGHAASWREGVSAPTAPATEPTIVLSSGGRIEGRVERDDGGPWAGAEIVAVAMEHAQHGRQNLAVTRSDAEGRFSFEHLPAVTLLVLMMRADERPDVRPAQVVEGERVVVDFLAPRRGIRLHGRLLDSAGRPMSERNLGLFDAETASWSEDWVASTTNRDGDYAFEGVEPGPYALYLVDDLGLGLRCIDEVELAAAPTDVQHDLTAPDGRLAVSVRRSADGKPVESALTLMQLGEDGRARFAGYGRADAQGRFEFTLLRARRYAVVAYPLEAGLGFANSQAVDVLEGCREALEILLEPGGAVDVVVRDADGRALEGASVVFYDEAGAEHHFSRVPLTDSSGRHHAAGLRPGRYRVRADRDGYAPLATTFELRLGREPEVPIVLEPLPLPR